MAHPIASEKYVAFTTYKKDGTAKSLPVWIADLGDDKVGFTTSSSSYKVKRLANNSKVLLQPSDSKGAITAGSDEISGTAVAVTGAEFDRLSGAVKKKYGFQYSAMAVIGKAAKLIGKGSGTDTAVVITLD